MENPAQDIHQSYDTIVKAFFRSEMDTLISHFLKGAILEGALEEAEQNVEIDRSMLKIDLAYWIKYLLLRAILHIELQSGPDTNMARRMLTYFACLHLKYNLPVFCIVIFLFKCAVEEPPYTVTCGDKVILPAFHYDVIRLWEEDAQSLFDQHNVPLYVLLPAMKDPTLDILQQAIRETRKYYDFERCGERLAQFHVILSRTTTVPDEIKDIIGKELSMSTQYAEFMKQNPLFQRELAESEAKGKVEGKTDLIVQMLQTHFSEATTELVKLALRKMNMQDVQVIDQLAKATIKLDKEGVDRWLKEHLPAE